MGKWGKCWKPWENVEKKWEKFHNSYNKATHSALVVWFCTGTTAHVHHSASSPAHPLIPRARPVCPFSTRRTRMRILLWKHAEEHPA